MISTETFPHPKTPWLFPQDVFIRLQSEISSTKKFAKIELDPSSPLWSFVHRYFDESRPRECVIDKIYALFNPTLTNAFKSAIAKNEAEASNPFFGRKWPKTDSFDEKDLRSRALQRWNQLTEPYSPFEIRHLDQRIEKFSQTRLFFGWHGAPEKSCDSIAKSGFTIVGKHPKAQTKSSDMGYFGSGVYFTTHSGYAVQTYGFNGNVLLAAVVAREPFPVVSDRKCVPPDQPKDMKILKGRGGYETYNTHVIPAVSCYPKNPYCSIYYPCSKGETPLLDEVVVFYPTQALPVVQIRLRAVADLYKSPGQFMKVGLFLSHLDQFLTHPDVQNHPDLVNFFKGEKQFLIAIDSKSSIHSLPELHQDFFSWISTFFDQAGKIKALEVQNLLPKIPKSSAPTYNQDDLFLFLREGKLDIVETWLKEDFSRSYTTISFKQLDIYRTKNFWSVSEEEGGWTIAHEAARSGHLSFLQRLVKQRPSFLKTGAGGLTLLHAAAYGGHIEIMDWLLRQNPALIEGRVGHGAYGYLPIIIAALNGQNRAVAWLSTADTPSSELCLNLGRKGLTLDFDLVVSNGKPDVVKQRSILESVALLLSLVKTGAGLTLDIFNCAALTPELLHSLLNPEHHFLTLDHCSNIKEVNLCDELGRRITIKNCPHLQKITVSFENGGCFRVEDCPMLTEVSLESSRPVTLSMKNNAELVHANLDIPYTSSFEASGAPKVDWGKIRALQLKEFLQHHPWNGGILPELLLRIYENDPNVRQITASHLSHGPKGISELADALKYNHTIESLSFSSAGMGDDEIRQLSSSLGGSSVKQLWLSYNEISGVGFRYLFEALRSNSTLETLSIGGNLFEKGNACKELSQFLRSNATLKRLILPDLSQDLFMGGGFDEIVDGLCENQGLLELDLSNSSDLFLIASSGLKRILQKNKFLKTLSLQRNNVGYFSKELGEGLAQNTTLTELDLGQNSMHFSDILDLFSKANSSLVRVSLSQCELVRMSLAALPCLRHVQILNLNFNKINDDGMLILADGLKADPCLVELNLMSNQISYSKLRVLVDGLRDNTNLNVIELAYNEIDDHAMIVLIELFEQKPYMTELRLSGNQITEKGAALIAHLLSRNTLTYLSLAGNPIGDAGAVKIAAALHQNTSLQTLCLSDCKIGDRGGRAFLSARKHNTSLVNLNLSGNSMSSAVSDQLSSQYQWNI